MTSCLLDSPCRGSTLWHSLRPWGLWRSRCYHLNCRNRAAASRLPRAPVLRPTWHAWLSTCQIFFSTLPLQITFWRLQVYWLLLIVFCLIFFLSFFPKMALWKHKEWWGEEGNSFFCLESTPQVARALERGTLSFRATSWWKLWWCLNVLGSLATPGFEPQPWDQGSPQHLGSPASLGGKGWRSVSGLRHHWAHVLGVVYASRDIAWRGTKRGGCPNLWSWNPTSRSEPHLHTLLAVWPWEIYLLSLGLSSPLVNLDLGFELGLQTSGIEI